MPYAFRSIGSLSTAFNASVTPGSPAGNQVGDLLAVFGWCVNGAITIPDLTSQGYTRLTVNSTITSNVIWGKIALGSDAMPTFQLGSDFQGAYCAAYSGAPASLVTSQGGGERQVNTTSFISFPGFSAPPDNNVLILGLGVCNSGSATGVSFGSLTNFTTRAIQVADNRPHAAVLDWIQTTPITQGISNLGYTPVNAANATATGELVFLKSSTLAAPPIFNSDLSLPPDRPRRPVHEFWQVAIELRTFVAPQQPFISGVEIPPTAPRPRSNVLLGIEQGIPAPLIGKDRVLTPVDWQYSWDPPQLPAALQYYGQGFDASDMTQLTNRAPYLEFHWPPPLAPRQWQRSWEAPVNLNLVGQDRVLLTGPANLSWDPPAGPRQPIANRSFEQASLSLFYTIPLKPPVSAEWPLPLRARQPVQDFIQGTPETLLAVLTTFPPFAASDALPPRRAQGAPLGFDWSRAALLRGQDLLPFGIRYDERQFHLTYPADLFTIAEVSQFLIPTTPPPPPSGLGVIHVGRIITSPAEAGDAVNIPFNFISGLAAGETVVSASTAATLYSGVDPAPQSIITAVAQAGGTIVLQQVTPRITGNIYDLRCTAITSGGQILSLETYFAVIPGLP